VDQAALLTPFSEWFADEIDVRRANSSFPQRTISHGLPRWKMELNTDRGFLALTIDGCSLYNIFKLQQELFSRGFEGIEV
jgi:hypothetical protein